MKAVWNNVVIGESDDTVVVENNHYFPLESINPEYLVRSDKTSVCSWKGTARYYSIVADGKTNKDAAWYYEDPEPAAAHIKGKVAFWRGVQVVE